MKDTNTETFVSIDNATNAMMNLAEKYQERTQYIETLALQLCACNWWEFSKKATLKQKILAHIDTVIKEDFIREHFTKLL